MTVLGEEYFAMAGCRPCGPERPVDVRDFIDAGTISAPETNQLFRHLVDHHQKRLYRFVLKNVGNPTDAEEIAQQYPTLALAEVYGAIAYYLRHEHEVKTYLAERQQRAAELRVEAEARSAPTGFRERLLARRSG